MENSRIWVLNSGRPGKGGSGVRLADAVRLGRFNTIISEAEVVLEEDVAGSDFVTIFDTWRYPASVPLGGAPPAGPAPVIIEAGAYLGFNCTIWPGVRVGRGAYVGEDAVVVEDVPSHAVVYGNPATVTRRYDSERSTWERPAWP
jgi:acetyltransferase-like isoleucine patch superfamily enzyme